jgi:hypothetical protein
MTTIRHEFFERATGYAYPVVAHEFTGKTLEEAQGYFRAHMKYDRLLRAVGNLGHSNGQASGAVRLPGMPSPIVFKSVVRIVR